MHIALPRHDGLRPAALQTLEVLDTPPVERFDRLTRLARRVFRVPIALVSLVGDRRGGSAAGSGMDATRLAAPGAPGSPLLHTDELLVVSDAAADPRFRDCPLVNGAPNIRFYAGCPLRLESGRRVGTLCLIDHAPREFGDDERHLLSDLASLAESELRALSLATTDGLTALPNRRGFEAAARRRLASSLSQDEPATMLYLDLDGFKQINDRFGHAHGDDALVRFARLLEQAFCDEAVLGRLGGDEFAVLVPGDDGQRSRAAIRRLRALAASVAVAGQANLEFSAGMARWDPLSGEDLLALLARADDRMYIGRRARRARAETVVRAAPRTVARLPEHAGASAREEPALA